MRSVKMAVMLVCALGLSACGSSQFASRLATAQNHIPQDLGAAPSYDLQSVTVAVPQGLVVSEANAYFPNGDIVWRGDPHGDRRAQVGAIIHDSMQRAQPHIRGAHPVSAHVELVRFHALSEKARYSVGGVHAISFLLSIYDADTGVLLRGPDVIKADLRALGGADAMRAEAAGQGQKHRITNHLARVFYEEMTQAQGFVPPTRGATKIIKTLPALPDNLAAAQTPAPAGAMGFANSAITPLY